jgi:hypothetical protein
MTGWPSRFQRDRTLRRSLMSRKAMDINRPEVVAEVMTAFERASA